MKSIIDFLFVCTTLIHFISSVQNVTENTSTRQNERHSSTEHTNTFHNEWPHYNSTGHYVTGHTNNDKTKQLISEEVQISQTGVSMTTTMTNATQTSSVLTKEGDMALVVLYRFLLFFVPLVVLTFIAFLYTTIRRRWKINKPLLEMM